VLIAADFLFEPGHGEQRDIMRRDRRKCQIAAVEWGKRGVRNEESGLRG
jgi:hypothetical protein